MRHQQQEGRPVVRQLCAQTAPCRPSLHEQPLLARFLGNKALWLPRSLYPVISQLWVLFSPLHGMFPFSILFFNPILGVGLSFLQGLLSSGLISSAPATLLFTLPVKVEWKCDVAEIFIQPEQTFMG